MNYCEYCYRTDSHISSETDDDENTIYVCRKCQLTQRNNSLTPKRVGTIVIKYSDYSTFNFPLADQRHPVYQYRKYFIVRRSAIDGYNDYYYEIYRSFDHGNLSNFDFYLNPEKGIKQLQDAKGIIDVYFSEKSSLYRSSDQTNYCEYCCSEENLTIQETLDNERIHVCAECLNDDKELEKKRGNK